MSGIQSLLKTEKEAAEIVNEARKYRTARLKSAKLDAQKEIDEYKKVKEGEVTAYEQKHLGLNELTKQQADESVQKELDAIQAHYKDHKDKVVELLIEAVTTPKPEKHENA